MSATQREPIVVVKRAWDEEANIQELIAYLQDDEGNQNKIINFIPSIDDGTKGIEHLLMRLMQKFRDHVEEAELLDGVIFHEFTKCLAGSTLCAWNHIINDPENGYHGDEMQPSLKPAIVSVTRFVVVKTWGRRREGR
jgi:hypothetical protein